MLTVMASAGRNGGCAGTISGQQQSSAYHQHHHHHHHHHANQQHLQHHHQQQQSGGCGPNSYSSSSNSSSSSTSSSSSSSSSSSASSASSSSASVASSSVTEQFRGSTVLTTTMTPAAVTVTTVTQDIQTEDSTLHGQQQTNSVGQRVASSSSGGGGSSSTKFNEVLGDDDGEEWDTQTNDIEMATDKTNATSSSPSPLMTATTTTTSSASADASTSYAIANGLLSVTGASTINTTTTTTSSSAYSSTTSASSAALLPSSSSNEPFRGPVIPMCVYLHNRAAILMEIEDTPTATVELLLNAIAGCDEMAMNKTIAMQVFTLWMHSPLLELQLKPSHRPYAVRHCWRHLVDRYGHASYNRQQRDEPIVVFQRNVFYPQQLEEKIKDQKIFELLYEEARHNVLEGRYPCEVAHYVMLGGIQARIELGPYNPLIHSIHYFREEQSRYLPAHVRKSSTWTWLPISSKTSAEVRLLEQFKRIPVTATNRKLIRKYLEFCWSLPFYGSAFFEGQIEQPVRGLTSLMTHQDVPVLVAINSKGVHVIDDLQCTVLLGLRYDELSWEYARPSKEDDVNCLPCLFLQFAVVENGARVSKVLQVFSKQASLMDTLIGQFVTKRNDKIHTTTTTTTTVDGGGGEEHQHQQYQYYNHQQQQQVLQLQDGNNTDQQNGPSLSAPIAASSSFPSLSNKLSRLTLATFDEDGHCIGQMGSWSFSY